ncbi:MAG: hypothetical protein ACOC4M_00135 [Promethearchaeia archaeon]
MDGVKLREKDFSKEKKEKKPVLKPPRYIKSISEKQKDAFNKFIQILNKISYLPLIIVSILILIGVGDILNFTRWISTLPERIMLGTGGMLISLYDIKYISPEIEAENFEKVLLDAFCWGILGSFILGSGTLILIKGAFVFIYALVNPKDSRRSLFDFGLQMKDSLNHFSAIGGFVIILLSFNAFFSGLITDFSLPPLITFLPLSSVALIIDFIYYRKELKQKYTYEIFDSVGLLVIGILGVLYFAAGIFILLKSVLIFFLIFGEPSQSYLSKVKEGKKEEERKKIEELEQEKNAIPTRKKQKKLMTKPKKKEETFEERKEEVQKVEITKEISELKRKESDIKKARKEKEKELELQLHDSLLPVKDKADKEVVKKYFSKIFTILSKEMREQINDLKISKKERKELLAELAFLSKEEQVKFMEEIVSLHKIEIPQKLIRRIKNLPNLKENHYHKIVEKLEYMDPEERVEYIQFLENHAY